MISVQRAEIIPSAQGAEGLCRRCGICCHAAVEVDRRLVVIEDLHCIHGRPLGGGLECSIYDRRHEVAPWCLPVAVGVALHTVAWDCPYRDGPSTVGKFRLPPDEYAALWPRIVQVLLDLPQVAPAFTWDAFFAKVKKMEPGSAGLVLRLARR